MRKVNIYGVFARLANLFIGVRKNHWVFGADYGLTYREGSKYLLEYMLSHHPDFDCTFITKSVEVYNFLKDKGIPCEMNFSRKGIICIARAEKVFVTQALTDINYSFKKCGRKFYFLVHGQPLKNDLCQLPEDKRIEMMGKKRRSKIQKLKEDFCRWLTVGYKFSDIDFVSSCSDFLAHYQRMEFPPSVAVKILGMPRNDALFQPERMKQEKWVEGLQDKFVVTYMPTHRKYGAGTLPLTPFANRPDVQQWFENNQVAFVVKMHPTMIPYIKEGDIANYKGMVDITKLKIDPQVCIYHSDVLITDFSSVWMDYLLLRRPTLFYIYDDFEHEDAGTMYDLREDPPGHFCSTEDELFELIKRAKTNYDSMRPSERIIKKYHKFIDGNSCQRYFDALTAENDEK